MVHPQEYIIAVNFNVSLKDRRDSGLEVIYPKVAQSDLVREPSSFPFQ